MKKLRITSISIMILFITLYIIILIPVKPSIEKLQQYVKEKIDTYNYGFITVNHQYDNDNSELITEEYILSTSKLSSYHSYIYRDNDSILYQVWDKLEDNKFEAYVYSTKDEGWVQFMLNKEPITFDLWKAFDNLDRFVISDNTKQYFFTNDKCWVLEYSTVLDNETIYYKDIYVRCKDYIPMGFVEYRVIPNGTYTEENKGAIKDTINESLENRVQDVSVIVPNYNTKITLFTIQWSNEDTAFISKPTEYIVPE